jgi:hypothetical protein
MHEVREEPEVQPGIFASMMVDISQIAVLRIVPNIVVLVICHRAPYIAFPEDLRT